MSGTVPSRPLSPDPPRDAAPIHRPRLLFVCGQARFFTTHRLPLARAAARAGYDVHLAVPAGSPGHAELAREGFPLHALAVRREGMNPWNEARTVVALTRLYRALRPDIVHHIGLKLVLYGTIAARLSRVPVVVNAVAGLGFLFTSTRRGARVVRRFARSALARTLSHPRARLILQNPTDRDDFLLGRIVRPESIVMTVGSGVDLDQFRPTSPPAGPPLVMLAARMLWHKGVGEFVDAARSLKRAGSDARFVLVGESDVNPATVPTAQLLAWQQEGVVEWWGHRDEMSSAFAAASIVCLPSYREGCPKVLLEAAASGRPIVTTDVPGCRDVVRDGVEGLLVPARDARALADALGALLAAPDRRADMGRAAHARAVREFSVEHVIRITLATYAELLVGAARRATT